MFTLEDYNSSKTDNTFPMFKINKNTKKSKVKNQKPTYQIQSQWVTLQCTGMVS